MLEFILPFKKWRMTVYNEIIYDIQCYILYQLMIYIYNRGGTVLPTTLVGFIFPLEELTITVCNAFIAEIKFYLFCTS